MRNTTLYFALAMRDAMAFFGSAAIALAAVHPSPALAEAEHEDWNVKGQSTYVRQLKQSFAAPYSGPNSLTPEKELSYSFTATLAVGVRPWQGAEFYVDPEVAQGHPLSGLTGLGGFTNGEMGRSSSAELKLYPARVFLRQTWGEEGADRDRVDSAANQLAGSVSRRRWVLTVGNLSMLDVFDANAYSHDPRTQFLNWTLMTHGAYDYAADARGYSWGTAVEWYHDDWVARVGRFAQPKEPNQMALDTDLLRHYGDQVEIEHAHDLGGQPGRVRALAFRNRTVMSRFADALDLAANTGTTPDINAVRTHEHLKYGFGLNIEQKMLDNVGIFGRLSWADGRTETYAFTEVDRSASIGTLVTGAAWARPLDSFGAAFVGNALAHPRRDYLAAGGISFFLGDGQLRYRSEQIVELFYTLGVTQALQMSVDWQHVSNPAYNADRGPVSLAALRLHTEF